MSYPPGGHGGYQQPGYGPPGYGGGYQMEHPDGSTVLIMGILSLVICGLVGPFAWSRGNKVLAEIDASPGRYSNRGTVNAGRICGMIASIILIVYAVLVVVWLIAAVALGSTS